MAAEYFLYHTGYSNTLMERSNTSFAPSPPYGEIYIDYFIPEIQSLYLYRESGGTIIYNSQETIEEFVNDIVSPPNYDDYLTIGAFTGYTDITAPATYVNVTGDTMTGTLTTLSNLHASGQVSGSSVYGSVWIHSPIISGSSCIQAPITCGKTCVISPVILGSTSVSSPILSASTCLCSIGTTRLVGATTAASTLNVSGVTKLGSTLCLVSTPTVAVGTDYTMFWNPTTKQVTAKLASGGSTNYYYSECATTLTTTSITPVKYLGYTGTSMPAGTYQVDFTEQVGQASSNNCVFGRFTINGVTQGSDFLLKMNVTNFTFTNTLSRDVILPAGTNCFDTYYWNGGGVACAIFASIRIRRI
jgi:hypothetical protein